MSTSTNPKDIYNQLVKTSEELKKLIDEIGEMVYNSSLSSIDKDLADYAKLSLEEERYRTIAKATTLKNLIYYRELKHGGSDEKH